jgi:hypothetical protein
MGLDRERRERGGEKSVLAARLIDLPVAGCAGTAIKE